MFALPDPPLADPARGIRLRPWRAIDALVLATAWAVPDIAGQATVPGRGAVADAERWIASAEVRRAMGVSLDLVVGPLDGEEVWGEVGLSQLRLTAGDATRDEVEIGWWVLPGHRRRGVATTAAGLLARWALAQPDVERLVARIGRGATGSETVAARVGLRRLASLDDALPSGSAGASPGRDLWVGAG